MPASANSPYDPLYLQEPLDYRIEFPVLGIPVRFATNDRAVLDLVVEVFGHWRGTETDSLPPSPGVDIRVFLHEGDEGSSADAAVTFRAPDPMRWIVHTPGSVGLADLERRVGVAYVTRALIADRARFCVTFLEFMVLIILSVEDRTPVHAAMIGRGDAALLLAGPAGTGKSTLAYAASKSGFDLMSDDAAYVQLEPRRVWGSGSAVLLLRDAAARFPELAALPTTLFPTGKRKMSVPPGGGTRSRRWVTRAGVCLLERSAGPVRVARIGPEEILEIVTHDPAGAGGRFGDRPARAAAWLSAQGGWRLSLSTDPSEAIPFLEELLLEIDGGAGAE